MRWKLHQGVVVKGSKIALNSSVVYSPPFMMLLANLLLLPTPSTSSKHANLLASLLHLPNTLTQATAVHCVAFVHKGGLVEGHTVRPQPQDW